MWWLGHLFLIACVFGLGVAWREVVIAYKALEQWFVYGSEDPATFVPAKTHAVQQQQHDDPFKTMQAKADKDKLAALKSAIRK